jgi:hypothetical protein
VFYDRRVDVENASGLLQMHLRYLDEYKEAESTERSLARRMHQLQSETGLPNNEIDRDWSPLTPGEANWGESEEEENDAHPENSQQQGEEAPPPQKAGRERRRRRRGEEPSTETTQPNSMGSEGLQHSQVESAERGEELTTQPGRPQSRKGGRRRKKGQQRPAGENDDGPSQQQRKRQEEEESTQKQESSKPGRKNRRNRNRNTAREGPGFDAVDAVAAAEQQQNS